MIELTTAPCDSINVDVLQTYLHLTTIDGYQSLNLANAISNACSLLSTKEGYSEIKPIFYISANKQRENMAITMMRVKSPPSEYFLKENQVAQLIGY